MTSGGPVRRAQAGGGQPRGRGCGFAPRPIQPDRSAGTSTLAAAVGRRLGASVVAGDDFYRDLPERRLAALSPAEGVDQYLDWQRLGDQAPLAVGLRAALLTFVLSEPAKGWLLVLCVAALIAAEGAFIRWYRHYRGTMPTGRPPVEMRPAAVAFVVGVLVLVGVVVPLAHLTPTRVPVSVAFVLTAALAQWYERAYARAATATRARLR